MNKGLVDVYGFPVSTAKLKQEQAAPTTRGVRQHYAHHPAAGLTPGKLANLLRESINGDPESYLALAEDMEERDLHYAGVLSIRKRQVAGLNITVEAAGDDSRSVEMADLVREVIERDGFEDELIDVLDAVGKGFSATEILWDTSEGQWRPSVLKHRDPRWFVFDQTDGETLLLRDVSGNIPLEPYKWIRHCAKVKSGLPIRGGLARGVSWAFLFKSFTLKDWAIFVEAYGQPLRLGKFGEGATEKDKDILLRALANIGVDYSAIVPASMAIEFIEAKLSGSHELYEKRADWLDRQVSKLVLGQTGTTDAIAGGHAVGKTHDKVREDIERGDARQLAATLNRDLARPLIDLNFGKQRAYPRIRIGREEEVDLDKFMVRVKTFVDMGGEASMTEVRDKIGLADPAKDEKLLRPVQSRALPLGAPPALAPPVEQSVNSTAAPKNHIAGGGKMVDAVDDATADILGDEGWEPLVAPMVAGLEQKIASCNSMDEFKAVLAEQFKSMDVSALTDKLAQAMFAAHIAGAANETLSDEG